MVVSGTMNAARSNINESLEICASDGEYGIHGFLFQLNHVANIYEEVGMIDDKEGCEKLYLLQELEEAGAQAASKGFKFFEAIRWYKKKLGVIESGPPSKFREVLMGYVHGKIGSIYKDLGRYDEAAREFELARAEIRTMNATAWTRSRDKIYTEEIDDLRQKMKGHFIEGRALEVRQVKTLKKSIW